MYIRYDRPVLAAANYELSPPEQDGGWSVVGVIPASEKIFSFGYCFFVGNDVY